MADSENVAGMVLALGRQLAALRHCAELTQQELSDRINYSRSAVSLAELGRDSQARDFWLGCDKVLDSTLVFGFDQIEMVRETELRAAVFAAQDVREARALAAFAKARQVSSVPTAVTGLQGCPHCGGEITVLTTLVPMEDQSARNSHSSSA